VGVACDLGYPCAKFRLPRPFGFRVRADVRDIRQTDRQTTDADDRLMPPPPPLRGGGIIMIDSIISAYCAYVRIIYIFKVYSRCLPFIFAAICWPFYR